MEENINALDEINKGTTMGMQAIDLVMNKVDEEDLKKVLKNEKEKYEKIAVRIEEIYKKYNNDDNPHEISAMNKAMTWWGIEMKTFMDSSNSKIAELLLQGVNMGIIEGKRILNNKNIDKEVSDIVEEFVKMQEESVETLKQYL